MTDTPDSFLSSAKSIRLSTNELQGIREKLTIHVRKANNERLQESMDQQNFLSMAKGLSLAPSERVLMKELLMESLENKRSINWFQPISLRFSRVLPVCMVLILLGSGVSFAAENTVPGDFLYPAKVRFTEEIFVRTQLTAQGRARAEASRIYRRLQEAEKLAERSKLTLENAAVIDSHLETHAKALESELHAVAKIDARAANNLSIDIETSIQAHENLLINKGSRSSDASVKSLVERARSVTSVVQKMSIDAEPTVTEATGERAMNEITKLRLELKAEDAANEKALLNAEADLKASNDLKTPESVRLEKAKSALRKAKEVKILLTLPAVEIKSDPTSSSTSSSTSSKPGDINIIVPLPLPSSHSSLHSSTNSSTAPSSISSVSASSSSSIASSVTSSSSGQPTSSIASSVSVQSSSAPVIPVDVPIKLPI